MPTRIEQRTKLLTSALFKVWIKLNEPKALRFNGLSENFGLIIYLWTEARFKKS